MTVGGTDIDNAVTTKSVIGNYFWFLIHDKIDLEKYVLIYDKFIK